MLLKGKHVLVTGATGFMGANLTRRLIAEGARVTVLARETSDFWRINDILKKIEVLHSDLADLNLDKFQPKLKNTRIVYHLGALGVDQSIQDIAAMMKTNILGTLSMLELAHHLKVERFIYCGSCFEYAGGNLLNEDTASCPTSEYGVSKLSAWMLVNKFHQRFGLPVVSLRPFTVYGAYEAKYRLIPSVINSVLNNTELKLTTGEQTRDFVFIEDVLEAFLSAVVTPCINGETFNIATGRGISVKDTVLMILKLMGAEKQPLFGALPSRKTEVWALSGDPSKAKDKLRFSAQTPLEAGLEKTIAWFKENRKKYAAYAAK